MTEKTTTIVNLNQGAKTMDLSFDVTLTLVESTDSFPVDFDDAWKWLGYSSKQKAEEMLQSNFIEGVDFLTLGLKNANGKRGRQSKHIQISIDCLKSLGMMAGTEKGKEIRRYFMECEKIAKAKAANPAFSPSAEEIRSLREDIEAIRLQVQQPAPPELFGMFQELVTTIKEIRQTPPPPVTLVIPQEVSDGLRALPSIAESLKDIAAALKPRTQKTSTEYMGSDDLPDAVKRRNQAEMERFRSNPARIDAVRNVLRQIKIREERQEEGQNNDTN